MGKVVLIITDGIGKKNPGAANAFLNARKPTYDYLFKHVPNSLITTYGEAVGLPDGQMGNSEVGHMTIGSGRVIYQDLVKINKAIREDALKDNAVFLELERKSAALHIFGLVSDGGVHSHMDHIIALARLTKKQVFIHAATDGRDVLPSSALEFIKTLQEKLPPNAVLATLSGRFYSMDRDTRWERVKQAYDCIIAGANAQSLSPLEYIQKSYSDGVFDEFIVPASFNGYTGAKNGEGFIFANFRSDRARQLAAAVGDADFMPIDLAKKNLAVATMTQYNKNFSFPVLFPKETPKNVLAEVISGAHLTQFHTAETEKYAHVTFFFNGGLEEPFEGETRVLIPSPKVKTYDLKPEMSAYEVTDAVCKAIDGAYDFIVVNFANGDMVGHTGNYGAALKAVEAVDECIGKILLQCRKAGYSFVLTSDHGNCEEMKDAAGNTLTNHTVGDVYCFVGAMGVEKISDGALDNIAPTVLKLMGLPIPKEMSRPLF